LQTGPTNVGNATSTLSTVDLLPPQLRAFSWLQVGRLLCAHGEWEGGREREREGERERGREGERERERESFLGTILHREAWQQSGAAQ
jgi:hypothetical protein